jgi:hypothetical protein
MLGDYKGAESVVQVYWMIVVIFLNLFDKFL